MENGLANVMMYGSGEGNTIKHYYDGELQRVKKKKKEKKMACKGKKKKGK